MNLFERLKDNYKEELTKRNIVYPALTGYIVSTLEENTRVRSLLYGDVMDLQSLLQTERSPYELFNEI
jgi:hypothetical protein|tara:strand:- start:174 stop:377 length:204 start_codon:yes stop_codon:yes gene_type:complete